MKISKKDVGKRGEDEACQLLRSLGWQILSRNYRCRMGELDIVASDTTGALVFVEVRSRTGVSHGVPEESVDYRKQNKLRKLAQQYLLAHPQPPDKPCRFDVVAVYFNNNNKKIIHITNAF
ncbi:YraN family protein [Desulfotomaculum varum]